MAAIDFPFAKNGTRRVPNATELDTGYACGPLDRDLDDFMRWWLTGQIDGVIEGAGLTTDDTDLQRLLKAIQRLSRGTKLVYATRASSKFYPASGGWRWRGL